MTFQDLSLSSVPIGTGKVEGPTCLFGTESCFAFFDTGAAINLIKLSSLLRLQAARKTISNSVLIECKMLILHELCLARFKTSGVKPGTDVLSV